DARPELKDSMKRAGDFLNLAVLATLLLAAAAIALSSRLQALRLRDEVALMKCLGATRGFIGRTLLCQQLLLAAIAGGAGVVLGAVIQLAA
ncbi:FtsX-like permease family protein, partial [Acinetobacter baumannii]